MEEIESACRQVERVFDFAGNYERLGIEKLAYMNVYETFAEAVSLFSDLPDIKIINDCYGLTLLADSLLRHIFYNLVDNSLKYCEKISQIKVYFKETGTDELKLVYEDDSIGIHKNKKEKIFEEGYGKGSGYGLHLIRKICEVYGWTILETGRYGKGAQFIMKIPKISTEEKENYKLAR